MSDISRLKNYLQKKYPNIKAYNTRNLESKYIVKIYDRDGIIVDYMPKQNYIEIFGLTKYEFEDLVDENGYLKTFQFRRRNNENEN